MNSCELFIFFCTLKLSDFLSSKLKSIRQAGWLREPLTRSNANANEPNVYSVAGRPLIQFCNNDYLGLNGDIRLLEAGCKAAELFGNGSGGSRLVTGTTELHRLLEAELAELKGTESSILFGSGFAANFNVITSLIKTGDLILQDELNHASLISGAAASGAMVITYPHKDVASLARLLSQSRTKYRNTLIVSDTLFSMDGDIAPLDSLRNLARANDAWLMLDDAHATGAMGLNGCGLVCQGDADIITGTCSKALGVEGGFVCGSKQLIEFVANRAKGFVYSTSPSPFVVGAIRRSLSLLKESPSLRDSLASNAQTIKKHCSDLGLNLISADSHIICLQCNDNFHAKEFSRRLLAGGIWVQAILPPTVKRARLRITPNASHTPQQLQKLINALDHMN